MSCGFTQVSTVNGCFSFGELTSWSQKQKGDWIWAIASEKQSKFTVNIQTTVKHEQSLWQRVTGISVEHSFTMKLSDG